MRQRFLKSLVVLAALVMLDGCEKLPDVKWWEPNYWDYEKVCLDEGVEDEIEVRCCIELARRITALRALDPETHGKDSLKAAGGRVLRQEKFVDKELECK